MDLVNRSAIWYLRELEEIGNRGDLSTADALCLLYQDRLLRDKTRETIKASADNWRKNCLQQGVRQQLAAAGRWMDWLRVSLLTFRMSANIAWLQYGPPVGERRTLQFLIQASERIAHLGLDQTKA